jgi:hypothetical protein
MEGSGHECFDGGLWAEIWDILNFDSDVDQLEVTALKLSNKDFSKSCIECFLVFTFLSFHTEEFHHPGIVVILSEVNFGSSES